ncbi:unnamed protein product [Malus baccata var. baccata]
MGVAEMRMLRGMCGHTRKDKIGNEDIRAKEPMVFPSGVKFRSTNFEGFVVTEYKGGRVREEFAGFVIRDGFAFDFEKVELGSGLQRLNMAATVISSVIANLKVLSHDNYEDWSFHFKTYLLAEDLWEVVEETSEPPRQEDGEVEFLVWRKNNAKVLHAIHTCCGDDTHFIIRGISSAKVAWDTLAEKLKPTDQALENTEDVPLMAHEELNTGLTRNEEYYKTNGDFNEFPHHQPLIDAVAKGDWSSAKKYLTIHPDAIRERGSLSGLTALHMAVSMENEYMAKEVVEWMTEEDLEIEDANGVTAIALATLIGPEVARCIIEKNKRLLCIPCNILQNMIPLIMACHGGHWGLARYLYSVTPLEALTSTQDNCRTGADLISHCFSSKELDIALDLIQRCPNLTFATNSTGKTLLQELACMPSLFLSGTRLRFWQQWIYKSIDIRHASGIHDVRIDVQKQANDPVNDQRDLIIRSVMALLQGLVSNLRKFFGIDHMYKMKQIHVQSLEVLQGMCKMTEGLSLKQMQGSFVQTALFKAVEHGNDEFLRQLFTANILALGIYDENAKGMFQFSIECRQEKVYNFFHEFIQIMNVRTESRVDKFNNTLLHSAAKLSPPAQLKHIQCAALQMQRELQWFKNDFDCKFCLSDAFFCLYFFDLFLSKRNLSSKPKHIRIKFLVLRGMMDGNNRNFFEKRPNIQFKRRGGNCKDAEDEASAMKGKWNDSSRKQPSEDYQLLNTVCRILCPSKKIGGVSDSVLGSDERVIIIYSSPTKISSKQSNHENLADGNEMEPHCAAQDALLKVHDRINSVVTTRLLVPNNMVGCPSCGSASNWHFMKCLIYCIRILGRTSLLRAFLCLFFHLEIQCCLIGLLPTLCRQCHRQEDMKTVLDLSGVVLMLSFNENFVFSWEIWWGYWQGRLLETGASIHAQDASKDSEESWITLLILFRALWNPRSQTIETILELQNRRSEFSDRGIITTRLLVLGCLLGQGEVTSSSVSSPIDHDEGPTPTDREARPELAMEEGLNAGHESNANDIHATFVKYVKSNYWDKAIQFLRDHPQVGSERISSGGTALRYAVRPLNNCSEDLEIQDTFGSTALNLLITFRQNRVEVVAKRMVEKNDKLLSILPADTTPLNGALSLFCHSTQNSARYRCLSIHFSWLSLQTIW